MLCNLVNKPAAALPCPQERIGKKKKKEKKKTYVGFGCFQHLNVTKLSAFTCHAPLAGRSYIPITMPNRLRRLHAHACVHRAFRANVILQEISFRCNRDYRRHPVALNCLHLADYSLNLERLRYKPLSSNLINAKYLLFFLQT